MLQLGHRSFIVPFATPGRFRDRARGPRGSDVLLDLHPGSTFGLVVPEVQIRSPADCEKVHATSNCMGAPRMLWLFNYNDQVCERGRKGLSRGEFLPDGMEPPKPEAMPRRKRRVILVIAVSAIVVAAGFLVWEVFVRPRSLAEVYGFDHWSSGSSVTVVGTIMDIERQNMSYGPEVYLELDGGPGCAGGPSVVGDPTATYAIGARFQTNLHFQRYTINGDPAGSAPEPRSPFPLTP